MSPSAAGGDAAPPPVLLRRHAAGSVSAGSLLITVLGEFVLPSGGEAWTSAFIDLLGRLGIEPKATRQALMRTASAGWIASERRGRRTLWRLTGDARKLLTEGTQRIYGFTGTAIDWDGRWLLVMSRIPETDRAARHHVRTRMAWAGLGSTAPGFWISAHAERLPEVEQVLKDAGVLEDSRIFVADYRGGGALSSMVAQAWNLDAIQASYRAFISDFGKTGTSDPLARTIELVQVWRRFPGIDPTLPQELLPRAWSGVKAATLFADRHARWTPEATAQWRGLNYEPR